jgi:quinol monooxygenase YgiN
MADELYVITHYDLIPPHADAGKVLLEKYAATSEVADGVERVELLQQLYRKNHFELVTVHASMETYEAHLGSPETIAFRNELQQMLGAPVEDRLHTIDTDR